MAQIQTVLWDWNGTLLDDRDVSLACLNGLLEEFGYPQRYDLATYQEIFGFPIEEYYLRAGFDFTRHPYPMLAQRYMQRYIPGAGGCGPTAGAAETLAALRRQGLRQVILSVSRRDTLIEQVTARGLAGYFDELLGMADIYGKSKVQIGRDWMERAGADPAAAVMLGAPLHAAEGAAALGVRCILFTGGHQSRARLQTALCPLADRLAQIPALLAALPR